MAQTHKLKFTPIPVLSSNYIWTIENPAQSELYIVDPGSSAEAIEYIEKHRLTLRGVLITHSHRDHTGGINELIERFPAPVYGPECAAIPQVTQVLAEGDQLTLWPSLRAEVLHCPGHLPEHLVFFLNEEWLPQPALFCGDVLFSSGCGRMFSGPATTFLNSLERLAALPEDTLVFCAHEYTEANLRFAAHVEPGNLRIRSKQQNVEQDLEAHACSLPTTIASERQTNPFLRCDEPAIRQRIAELSRQPCCDKVSVFEQMRALKDHF